MNRAFLIIIVPAALAAAAYFGVARHLGVRLDFARLLGAGVGLLGAAGLVYFYRRRKARPSGG